MKKLYLLIITVMAAVSFTVATHAIPAMAALEDGSTCTAGSDCISDTPDPAAVADCSKDNGCDLVAKYVNPGIKFLSIVVGLAVAIGIAYGGIEYASSGGDPSKAASGKSHIVKAVVALISYIFIFALLQFLTPGGI